MTRQTSIDCYNQIKAEGLLSKMRFEVYKAILLTAPCTSAEAFSAMGGKIVSPLSQSRARFTELRELGVIKEIRQRKCRITGRTAIEWDLTDRLPKKPVKEVSNRPPGLKKCIDYIIQQMDQNGIMFIGLNELKTLKN